MGAAISAESDALIVDLRDLRGGGEAMQLLARCFVDEPTDFMLLRYRDGRERRASSQSCVPGRRYGTEGELAKASERLGKG